MKDKHFKILDLNWNQRAKQSSLGLVTCLRKEIQQNSCSLMSILISKISIYLNTSKPYSKLSLRILLIQIYLIHLYYLAA